MMRSGLVALVVLVAVASARAGELPRRSGMYTQPTAPLAMLDSNVEVRVNGPIAEATITQTFRNDRDQATEATYVFPLPADAAVSAMAIEVGTRTIHAAIARREDAQRRYEDAVSAGLGAGLLDQERPDVFTQTVSAIPAHGTVKVTLRVDATAQYASGIWQLALPLVVAPRYVPGTASGRPTTGSGRSPDTDRAPDASRVTPGGTPGAGGATRVALEFASPVEEVASPTHDLKREGNRYTFVDPASDHDAIVRWRASVPAAGWVEEDADGGYAAILVTAPPIAKSVTPPQLVVILDRAATTRGDADAVEHPLVRALLGSLAASDRVAVTGSDRIEVRAPEQAARALEDAWQQTKPGAFDLTKVLAATHANGAAIVLVSDGLVADDRAAIAAARKVGAPIHVIGIGPAPNRSLLAGVASATGGTLRFALPSDDLSALARDALADAASPPPPLAVTWGTLAATEIVPATLPRLGAGQAALVLARVTKAQRANGRVGGDVFAFAAITATKPPAGATTPNGALARRWARMRLDELIAAGDARAIAAHALRYGLVSPATSMIALGDEVVVKGGVKHTVSVPVSVPAGMRWQEVRRQTAVEIRTKDHREEQDTRRSKEAKAEPKEEAKKQPKPTKPAGKREHDAPVANTGSARPGTVAAGPQAAEPPTQQQRTDDVGGRDENAPVAHEAPSTPSAGEKSVAMVEAEDASDVEVLTSAPGRRRRLALGLGGGLSLVNGQTDYAVVLNGRYEAGGKYAPGVEGSLWIVGGNVQGGLLATLTHRAAGHFLDLGIGAGVRFGVTIGPAIDLLIRVPWRRAGFAPLLRYDGALLFHDGTVDGQSSMTLGVEASF